MSFCAAVHHVTTLLYGLTTWKVGFKVWHSSWRLGLKHLVHSAAINSVTL